MKAIEPDEVIGPGGSIVKTKKVEKSRVKRYLKRKLASFGNFLLIKVEQKLLEQENAK